MENYEKFMRSMTDFGTYQKRVSLSFILFSYVVPTIVIIMPMMHRTPEFSFNSSAGLVKITNVTDFCSNTYYNLPFDVAYDSIIIDNSVIDNWASDLKIVCDTKKVFALISTLYFLGSIASNFGLRKLPDLYGRKKTYIILNFILAISILNLCFLFHYSQLVFSAFFIGFASLNMSLGAVIVNEVIDKSHSGTIIGLANATFPISGILNTLMIFFFGNYRFYIIFVTLIAFFGAFFSFFFVKESPKWLIANGQFTKFIKIIRYILHVNKSKKTFDIEEKVKEFFDKADFSETDSLELKSYDSSYFDSDNESESRLNLSLQHQSMSLDYSFENKKAYEISDLFYYPSLRLISICTLYLWMASGFSFYGLLLNLENMTGNIFIDSGVSYTGELLAEVVSGYIANIYGKKVLFISFLLSTFGSLIFEIFSSLWIRVILLFISAIGTSAAFNILYIFSAQYYPTNVKSLAMSFFSLSNRISAGLVPYALSKVNSLITLIGFISAFGAFCTYLLPECLDYEPGDEILERSNLINRRLNKIVNSFTLKKKNI